MRGPAGLLALLLLASGGCEPRGGGATVPLRVVEPEEIRVVPTEARFFSVREVAASDDALWVLSGEAPFLTRVALEDGGVVEFGSEGEGPEELRNPWAIQPIAEADAIGIRVWDIGSGRVSSFESDGSYLGSERLSADGMIRARTDIRQVSYADPFRIRGDAAGVFVARFPGRVNRTGDVPGGSLWHADHRLEPGRELTRFADHVHGGSEGLKEWAAVPLWDACDGTVVLWAPDSARVVWLDSLGGTVRTAAVHPTPVPVTLEDIEAFLRQMSRLELGPDHEAAGIDYGVMARTVRDQFAAERPFATDLRCQDGGKAWLRLFDTAVDPLGRGQSWLGVSPDAPSRQLTFPAGFTPVLFLPDRVYGLLDVPMGFQRLAWWSDASDG